VAASAKIRSRGGMSALDARPPQTAAAAAFYSSESRENLTLRTCTAPACCRLHASSHALTASKEQFRFEPCCFLVGSTNPTEGDTTKLSLCSQNNARLHSRQLTRGKDLVSLVCGRCASESRGKNSRDLELDVTPSRQN
jgi:hypothetical protein